MKLFGIPNCNTVKKARDWLTANSIPYTFHDFKKHGLDCITVESWLTQQPWESLLNRSGMTWRNLDPEQKAAIIDAPSAAALMVAQPSVIKRPLLLLDGKIIALGFKEAEYAQLFIKD